MPSAIILATDERMRFQGNTLSNSILNYKREILKTHNMRVHADKELLESMRLHTPYTFRL